MARKKDTNGTTPAGWDAVAKASAENEAAEKKAKRKKGGEQLRIKVDSRDAVHVKAEHELHRPMTHAEWEEQSALLADSRVALMALEDEIKALQRKHAPEIKRLKDTTAQGARQCAAREWLTMTPCIEVHDVNTRTVTVFADVNGELGAMVVPPRPMRPEEYERAVKGAPFEPPDGAEEALDPPGEASP